MADEITVEKATFTPDGGNGMPISVHFNPVSLQYTISNTLQEQGQNKRQYVTKSTAKLTMDLVFDTTDDGTDVRETTSQIARFMQPQPDASDRTKLVPAIVLFEWGTFSFQGMVESYKETLDFFAPEGVPLRATINLGMAQQDTVFERDGGDAAEDQDEPVVPQLALDSSASDVARMAGNPGGGRGLAKSNNLPTMRFGSGPIAVSAAVSLKGPAGFANASAGIGGSLSAGISGGISAGASGGIGASIGGGIGGGASFGASASAGAGASFGASASAGGGASFGASASAGVPATAGAFAGLRANGGQASVRFDTGKLLAASGAASASAAIDPNAAFQVGGQGQVTASASLRADVGAQARIQFDED